MSRYIDVERIPKDEFFNGLTDAEKAKVLQWFIQAPTADVIEVIHAQWIKHIDPLEWCEDDVDVYYECSNCGCNNYGESPYCPNCGAKMDVAWIDGDYEFCEV
jgi:rubrerythrin